MKIPTAFLSRGHPGNPQQFTFLFHAFLFLVKNHLHYPQCSLTNSAQLSRRFGCVVLADANIASSSHRSLVNSLLSNSTPPDIFLFQTCRLQTFDLWRSGYSIGVALFLWKLLGGEAKKFDFGV